MKTTTHKIRRYIAQRVVGTSHTAIAMEAVPVMAYGSPTEALLQELARHAENHGLTPVGRKGLNEVVLEDLQDLHDVDVCDAQAEFAAYDEVFLISGIEVEVQVSIADGAMVVN